MIKIAIKIEKIIIFDDIYEVLFFGDFNYNLKTVQFFSCKIVKNNFNFFQCLYCTN